MDISLFDYNLPKELIAQKPAEPRDHSRLLVIDRDNRRIYHHYFYELPQLLNSKDVLVMNESRVIPARLCGQKKTGGHIEIFLLRQINTNTWQVLVGGRKPPVGDIVKFSNSLQCQLVEQLDSRQWQAVFNLQGADLAEEIDRIGRTPLPPYIKEPDNDQMRSSYQTVYARVPGSVAAPTAGFHFTPELLKKVEDLGVEIKKLTLHVSWWTFAPVYEKDITEHKIHEEWVDIADQTAKELNEAKAQGKKIIAVGTTTVRALEAMADSDGILQSGGRWVDNYIYPGYKFKFVDEVITNFHLPKSSLMFLVSALAGRELILDAYQQAIKKKYRFYSFGDATFITKNRLA